MPPTAPLAHGNIPITPISAHEMKKHPVLSSRSLIKSRLQVRDYRYDQSTHLSHQFCYTYLTETAFLRDPTESRASLPGDASRGSDDEALRMAQSFQAPPFNGKELLAAASLQNIMRLKDSMVPKPLPYKVQGAGIPDTFWQLQLREVPTALEVPLVSSLHMKVRHPNSAASLHMRYMQTAQRWVSLLVCHCRWPACIHWLWMHLLCSCQTLQLMQKLQ